VGKYPKNDIWRLYERSITYNKSIDYLVLILPRIYTLLQRSNENTNSLNNEHVNEEQEIIDSSSIISSSDNILIEFVAELYQRTKQSSTLSYEALLLLRPLPLFASTQQLYLQILAYTIFAFFFVF
ncbi:unnamed protein product, partial [Rotaria sp. Silwood2]